MENARRQRPWATVMCLGLNRFLKPFGDALSTTSVGSRPHCSPARQTCRTRIDHVLVVVLWVFTGFPLLPLWVYPPARSPVKGDSFAQSVPGVRGGEDEDEARWACHTSHAIPAKRSYYAPWVLCPSSSTFPYHRTGPPVHRQANTQVHKAVHFTSCPPFCSTSWLPRLWCR